MNRRHGFRTELEEILYIYTLKRHNLGKYCFVASTWVLQLVVNLLDTSKNKPQGNIMIFGVLGCTKDPMLKEYKINMNLESGRTCGPRAFSLSVFYFDFSVP